MTPPLTAHARAMLACLHLSDAAAVHRIARSLVTPPWSLVDAFRIQDAIV